MAPESCPRGETGRPYGRCAIGATTGTAARSRGHPGDEGVPHPGRSHLSIRHTGDMPACPSSSAPMKRQADLTKRRAVDLCRRRRHALSHLLSGHSSARPPLAPLRQGPRARRAASTGMTAHPRLLLPRRTCPGGETAGPATSWSTPTGSRTTWMTERGHRRGRRGHVRVREEPHQERDPDRLDQGPPEPGPRDSSTRRASRSSCRRRASPTTRWWSSTAATTTGSRPTPIGTSSCTATRTSSSSTVAARSGARLPRPGRRGARARRDRLQGQGPEHRDPRLPRRRRGGHRFAEPGRRPLARTCSAASCSPRPTFRRSSRSVRATSQRPATSRGRRTPTTTAPSSRMTNSRSSTPRSRSTSPRTPSRTAVSASVPRLTWFVLHELLGGRTSSNSTYGSWTEYGSLVGVPIELGANK